MARGGIALHGGVSGAATHSRRLGPAIAAIAAIGVLSSGTSCDDTPVSDATNSVASVVLRPESLSLTVSETAQFEATLHNVAGDVVTSEALSWASSNRAVATVSKSGVVTAVAPGEATITARSSGKSGSATVFVVAVDHIVVAPTTASITSGSTQAFTATGYDGNNTVMPTRTVTWASSNTSVATVNASGLATGIAAGLATISATTSGKTASATLAVTTVASCELVDDANRRSTSPLAKPGYLQSVTDPDFGTTITRITGDPGTQIPVVGGTWSTVVYGNYSKDPAWNADQSLLLLKRTRNPAQTAWLFLDGQDYRMLFARRGPSGVDARWHPTTPDIMLSVSADASVGTWNVRTNVFTLKFKASGYTGASFGNYEGNLSRDGRYLVVQATRNSDGHLVAFAVDVDAATKWPDIDLTAADVSNLDWASISAGGAYVVAYGVIDGRKERTKVWRRDGTFVAYWQDYTFGHYDLGLDASGNEVAFGAVGQAPYSHHYIARRLDTAAIVDLSSAVTSFNWHATTRATARVGWGYASTNDNTGYPLDGEIYAVKLDGSGALQRYVHHRANNIDYDSAPYPTPSPDGRRLLFASNWGNVSGRPVQAYVADTRQLCPNGLPQ